MANKKVARKTNLAERLAGAATRFSGTTAAFLLAVSIVAIWVVTGPLFGYSDTWQLVINTGTTIVTFLMVFLIQRQQNKDSLAIHLKLSELVAALEGASNRLVTSRTSTRRRWLCCTPTTARCRPSRRRRWRSPSRTRWRKHKRGTA